MTVTDARCTISTHARMVHHPHRWWADADTAEELRSLASFMENDDDARLCHTAADLLDAQPAADQGPDLSELVTRLDFDPPAAFRDGCCADRRKPCEYHAAYSDGWEIALLTAVDRVLADREGGT